MQKFLFLHILTNIVISCLFDNSQFNRYEVVLICISHIINNINDN